MIGFDRNTQAFTTGSTADAYELTEVKVEFVTVPSSTATVTAFIADGRGASDNIIATLTNPATWATTSTFTVPDGITLDANTTYHLIIEGTGGELALTHLYHREPRLGEDSPRFDRFSHVTY